MRAAVVALLLAAAACAPALERPLPREPEPARARAALATLRVHNATVQPLRIFYRITTRATGEVGIGLVAPLGNSEMAPVPAGEPIVLIARTNMGAELILLPRTFELQGEWTWAIPADAVFVMPPPAGAR